LFERVSPPFHHLANLVTHGPFLQRAPLTDAALAPDEIKGMNHLGVAVHHDVRVVGDNNQLPPQLVLSDLAHDY
jgi:hypothetical protein